MNRRLRKILQELFKSHQARGTAKNIVTDLGLNVDHQLIEQLKGFGFVFNERIPLTVST